MKKQTQAIHTQFQRRDAYNSLSMPVYHTRLMSLTMPMIWLMLSAGGQMLRIIPE